MELENGNPFEQDAGELAQRFQHNRMQYPIPEDGKPPHWALVRYGGPESEAIQAVEWGAWRKHIKRVKRWKKRPPQMRSSASEDLTLEELEDENQYLREQLKEMDQLMMQMQRAKPGG